MIKSIVLLGQLLLAQLAAALLSDAMPAIAQTIAPSPAPANSFDSQPDTIFENITLTPTFAPDPETVRGISGGAEAASDLTGRAETATGPCSGFIDQQPDHRILLTQYFNFLSIQVQSADDTTLVIRGPGGTWCNDSYSGQNPGVSGQWLSGTYDIWVGSPSENAYYPYVIRLSRQNLSRQK